MKKMVLVLLFLGTLTSCQTNQILDSDIKSEIVTIEDIYVDENFQSIYLVADGWALEYSEKDFSKFYGEKVEIFYKGYDDIVSFELVGKN